MQTKRFTSTSPAKRLIAVEESYHGAGEVFFGIGGFGVHLSAEDAREAAEFILSIAGPAPEPEPAHKFEKGDRVVQVEEHYYSDEEFGSGRVYRESPNGIGSTATVLASELVTGDKGHVRVEWDTPGRFSTSVIATRSLALAPAPAPAPAEPVLKPGARAEVEYGSDLRFATRVEVVEVLEDGRVLVRDDGSNMDAFRFDGARAVPASSLRVMSSRQTAFYPTGLYPTGPEPAGNVEGLIVYVTGDSDSWHHGFETGEAVKILDDDDVLDDGSYYVESVKDDEVTGYVGSNDLAIDSPRVQEIPNGTQVRIMSDGRDEGLRHYLDVGSIGVVTGWLDTSAEPGSRYSETYRVEGTAGGEGLPGLTQSLALESFEVVRPEVEFPVGSRVKIVGDYYFGSAARGSFGTVVEPNDDHRGSVQVLADGFSMRGGLGFEVEEIEKVEEPTTFQARYMLGMDPAVADWKAAMSRFSIPAPKPLPVCGVPGCIQGCPTR